MKNKRLLMVVISMLMIGVTSCNNNNSANILPSTIRVELNEAAITSIQLDVAQTVNLTAVVTPSGSNQSVTWVSNNDSVATVTAAGALTGVSKGNAVITVASTQLTFVSQQFFVEVKQGVMQLGVGSGKSSYDPIFLGNEGEDEPLEIYFIETYDTYGDSIYLKKGNVDVIIDAANTSDGLINNPFIKEKVTDGRVDLLAVTHAHGDHYGGIRNILNGIDDVSVIVDYGITSANPDYKQVVSSLIANGSEYYPAIDCVREENGAVGRFYLTSEFYVEVLNTGAYITAGDKGAENPASVAMMFYYRDFKFFTAGDLTSGSERTLLINENLPKVTLYKASHHASGGSNSQALLDTLDPKAVAISVTRSGKFNVVNPELNENNTSNLNGVGGHPHIDAVERIYNTHRIKENLNVYWNAVNGTMKFTTYGEDDFTFEGSKALKGYYDLTLTGGIAKWNPMINDFDNKVVGEENKKFHETKVFEFRGYSSFISK